MWIARGWDRIASAPRCSALALFAGSLALRAVFAYEMVDTPLFRLHESPNSDQCFFAAWAERIADGDWVGSTPLHPFHEWQGGIAREWARTRDIEYSEELGVELWNRWYGGLRFHQEPLYAYLLALLRLAGRDVRWVFALQALASAATTVLVWAIGRRLGGQAVGLVGAALHLAYGPFLFYDFALHRTSFHTFAGVLVVWSVLHARASDRVRDYVMVGGVLGVATLLKSTDGPMLAVVAIVTAAGGRRGATRALAMVGTYAVVLCPVAVRNVAMGIGPLDINSVGAAAFVFGNADDVHACAGLQISARSATIFAESDGRLGSAALATIRTHRGLGWPRLLLRKIAYLPTPVEIPNVDSYAYFVPYSWLLSGPLIGFAPLVSLVAIGLGAGLAHRRQAWPILAPVAMSGTVMVVFIHLSRYRVPIVAVALPLVGLAVVDLARHARARRVAPFLWAALLASLPWIGLSLVGPVGGAAVRADDGLVGAVLWERTVREVASHDPHRAYSIATRALASSPDLAEMQAPTANWPPSRLAGVAGLTARVERASSDLARQIGVPFAHHDRRAGSLEAFAERVRTTGDRWAGLRAGTPYPGIATPTSPAPRGSTLVAASVLLGGALLVIASRLWSMLRRGDGRAQPRRHGCSS